jgi:hypothetical protein
MDSSLGNLQMQTFKKLPIKAPKITEKSSNIASSSVNFQIMNHPSQLF